MKYGRREFLRILLAVTAKTSLYGCSLYPMGRRVKRNGGISQMKFPQRLLGKTGQYVSIVGLGGIVVTNTKPEHAAKIVAEAIETGLNYFDVAPTYGDAELKLGPALKPYRRRVFLACKTTRRDRKGAKEELHRSLKRLETDHLDLYQLHAIKDVEKDVKASLSKEGAIQTFIEARRQGIIRYLGFSAHSREAALTAMQEFDFDTIMYPVNFVCHYNSNFETDVLAEAKKRNMGIIAIKATAKQRRQKDGNQRQYPKCWYEPIDTPHLVRKALSWSLAQGITVAIPPGDESLYKMAVKLAPSCKPPSSREIAELKEEATQCGAIFP